MPLRVEPVRTSRDLHRFVTLPWKLYADDPAWVPPLIGETKKIFDPEKNPFFRHGEMQAYLALRDETVVGRIAAIRNRNHEEFHGEATGFFGFFESVDDVEVARGLLETVKEYLRSRHLDTMLGPVNPTTNDECGVLVDGFEHPPAVMMTHSPPYYDGLLKRAGVEKAKDLLAFLMHDEGMPERLVRGAKIARKRNPDVVVRPMDKKRFRAEVEIFRRIYNAAWERNWGFVPMTDPEIDHMADQLKQIVDPGLVRIAEKNGEPIGVALGLPDVNQALRHANGRLFPLGLLKILWHSRRIDLARFAVLGLLPEHRRSGVDVLLYHDLFAYGTSHGFHRGEFSWILEDNEAIVRPLRSMGAEVYKTYRLYRAAVNGH
jgi:hypothetical protein